eukprot:1325000-Rhodomonas_salina.1
MKCTTPPPAPPSTRPRATPQRSSATLALQTPGTWAAPPPPNRRVIPAGGSRYRPAWSRYLHAVLDVPRDQLPKLLTDAS